MSNRTLRHALPASALTTLALTFASPAFAASAGTNGVSCGFTTVQAAINAAPAGGTVFIAEGWATDPGFVVNKRLTIKRGNASCQSGGTNPATLDFQNAGRAEVSTTVNSVGFQDIVITGGVSTSNGGGLSIGNGAIVTLDRVQVLSSDAVKGGGIYVGVGAQLRADGLRLLLNEASDGGGLYADTDSVVDLSTGLDSDLAFYSNSAGNLGGAINCASCTLDVTRGAVDFGVVVFDGNSALDGGAIAISDSSSRLHPSSITSGTFSGNSAYSGGAMSLRGNAALLIDGPELYDNSADLGGALFVAAGNVTLTDLDLHDNVATTRGGAIYTTSADVTASALVVDNNTAPAGGGINVAVSGATDHTVTVNRSNFRFNTATGSTTGSDVDVQGAHAYFTISNSLVAGGTVTVAPGAAIVGQTSSHLTVNDSTVAYGNRWGVATVSGATAALYGVIVWGNSSGGVTGSGSGYCTDIQSNPYVSSSINISSNPLFLDPAGLNLTLQSTSPALDRCPAHTGTSLDGYSRNTGPANMGAYNNP